MGTNESLCNCIFSKEQNGLEERLENTNHNKFNTIDQMKKANRHNEKFIFEDEDKELFNKQKWVKKKPLLSARTAKKNDATKLQAFYRGIYIRRMFHNLKPQLADLTKKKIECYQMRFNHPNISIIEEAKGKFNPLNWTKYYPQDKSSLFAYNYMKYGRTYPCELLSYKDISFYIGSVNIKYQRCNQGILIDITGMKYEGMWGGDKLNGWGRIIDSEGNLFEGLFVDNILKGKGEKYTYDGTMYIGDFHNGLMDGKGYEETTEHIYEGDFYNDRKEGKGKLQYKNKGDVYEGDFFDNRINGVGNYLWENKDRYIGQFNKGKMNGKGKYLWADGDQYEGDYIDGIKEGNGVFKWYNGKVYSGPFVSGKPHGNGIFYSNNKKYNAEFSEGKMMNTVEIKPSQHNST